MSSERNSITDLDYRIRRTVLVLLYLVILSLCLAIAAYLRPIIQTALDIIAPFAVAAIVAYIFNPIVRSLQVRFRLRRLTGVLYTYLLILLLTATFFAVIVPLLYVQLKAAAISTARNTPRLVERTQKWLRVQLDKEDLAQVRGAIERYAGVERAPVAEGDAVTSAPAVGTASEDVETSVPLSATTGAAAPTDTIPGQPSQAGGKAATAAARAAGVLGGNLADAGRAATRIVATFLAAAIGAVAFSVFVIVITFYFLLDYGRTEHVVRVLLPAHQEQRFFDLWNRIDRALGGFLRGQLTVAIIVAVLYAAGLSAMGMMPYAILIGFLAGFGNLIPYLGPVIGGVPTALWVLFGDRFATGQEKILGLGLVIALSVAIQAIDGFFLQPRIVGRQAELHPLLVILALLVGSQFGLGGLILAVPLAIVARVLFSEFIWRRLEAKEAAEKAYGAPEPEL